MDLLIEAIRSLCIFWLQLYSFLKGTCPSASNLHLALPIMTRASQTIRSVLLYKTRANAGHSSSVLLKRIVGNEATRRASMGHSSLASLHCTADGCTPLPSVRGADAPSIPGPPC